MADYVASRVTPKQLLLPAHATTLENLPQMGTKIYLGAASTADAATVLQAVQAVLADVLGTFVLPDQPLMQVRYRLQCHGCSRMQTAFVDGADVAQNIALAQAGLDSLGAVELRNGIAAKFGIALPSTVAFDYPTPKALALYIAQKLHPAGTSPAPEQVGDFILGPPGFAWAAFMKLAAMTYNLVLWCSWRGHLLQHKHSRQ